MMPLIEILFFIAVNLVPADVASFSIVEDGGNTTQFVRQKDGGWEVKESRNKKWVGSWYLKNTMVSVVRTDGKSETDLAQQFTIPANADWRTLNELKDGPTTILSIDRQKRGARVTFGEGRKTEQTEIQWTEAVK